MFDCHILIYLKKRKKRSFREGKIVAFSMLSSVLGRYNLSSSPCGAEFEKYYERLGNLLRCM
jgi:hypothetical protein